ncbi:conserved Plasmodium protein, unknown function [Plasmodium knowlesi strain H]|uniref:Uncharacterized protein n=3 Tax=Plasmodium knowlesi TaxID=5850 RepID=A0A5K1UY65_PLAKH|nr:conserved protein, unknown function [Plasmodium knowlesi strain H]OTN65485.1 Uncharacterized protein PKNOH_S110102200 [Plasmodium knowlesi]CAA9989641.1 conserved protein, unknown function [Plasmodium knowlesi strain H]SBO22743.1 conserved Plasmodium protein, unknown function [Plasmodium knowlesi strain H]SBO23166.1 conserved Plasmodium protein, unknown function [Plasmodium knowlesi strain H]VVS79115.1 conserved protein, unknown function [Plasmodium knowlesi strain H]|eukprot:XP_002260365.1 hypothetical protein, conserved in Plasmodium species [Plasmodium knowlesi strain H]
MLRISGRRCKHSGSAGGSKWKSTENPGTQYRKVNLKWDERNISLHVFDLVPRNKNNAEMLEMKSMNIIKDMSKTNYDFAIFGIGYVDYDKILKSFNRAELVRRKMIDSIHSNMKKVNGQYISLIQQCLLLNIPHFCLGRDRLTELASIGTAIFSNPKEILSLAYYFLLNSDKAISVNSDVHPRGDSGNKKNDIELNLENHAPNFYHALIAENALYLIYNLHAILLKVFKSKFYVPPNDSHKNRSSSKYETNNLSKQGLKDKFFSFFNETTYDQINAFRNQMKKTELYAEYELGVEKKEVRILVVCDTICVDYFCNYVKNNLHLWKNVTPFYHEIFVLEKKNAYKFSLSLFLFIFAPAAWTLTLLIRYLYHLWVEYFTKGKVITVGGDAFFQDSKLIDTSDDNPDLDKNYNQLLTSLQQDKADFEPVSLLGGFLQWFKNKSRN